MKLMRLFDILNCSGKNRSLDHVKGKRAKVFRFEKLEMRKTEKVMQMMFYFSLLLL
jgi:hypothetical protein